MKLSKVTTALAFGMAMSHPAMANWSADALSHQYRLQKHEPIVQGVIAGTHNSYSSNAYNLKLYENQDLSITSQLNAGARFLEFDMWRTRDVEYGGIYLCHNGGRCSTPIFLLGDYIYLDSALREIAVWAKANPDQVLIIKVENGNMENEDFDILREGISVQIGDIVYQPPRNGASDSCKKFPATLTPAQMLAQGKQVLFYGYTGCDADNGSLAATNEWIFDNTNGELDDDKLDDMKSAANSCSRHSDGTFALFYEGREEIVDIKTGDAIPDYLVADLAKCGGTFFGFDWLEHNDSRMKSAVWSWAENQPDAKGPTSTSNINCAVNHQNRFYDDDCGLSFAFSCENEQQQWKITSTTGAWNTGESSCQAEFGGSYHFSVAKTSKQNQAVKAANTANVNYWMNYQKSSGDGWLSGQDKSHQASLPDKSSRLKATVVTDYRFIYSDAGTGSNLGLGVYRPTLPAAGWYMLGDTPAFAAYGSYASGYTRTPGRTLAVYDDGTGKLASPIHYSWLWNDWKTGGDNEITFWRPVPPAGYTCLGDVAVSTHNRSQPVLPVKCVRDDLLQSASADFYWSDSGSGGEYDAFVYLTVPTMSTQVNYAAAPNTVSLGARSHHKVLNFDKINIVNGPKSIISF